MNVNIEQLKVDDFIVRSQSEDLPRAYGDAIYTAAQQHPDLVCLCADLVTSTETDSIRDHLPEQFVQTGIAEANMMGMAAGMASCGHIALTHTFSVFSTRRAFDQIAMQIAYPKANVKMVGFLPGVLTLLGVSHQAIDDLALMRVLPHLYIAEPYGPEQIAAIVEASIEHRGPVYLRMRRDVLSHRSSLSKGKFEFGRATVIREGDDLVIFALGIMVEEALTAADQLIDHGISVAVIDMASLKPLDTATVLRWARRCGRVITAENHSVIGGLGSAVAEVLAENGVGVPLRRIGLQDMFAEGGSRSYLLNKYGMDAIAIASVALELHKQRR